MSSIGSIRVAECPRDRTESARNRARPIPRRSRRDRPEDHEQFERHWDGPSGKVGRIRDVRRSYTPTFGPTIGEGRAGPSGFTPRPARRAGSPGRGGGGGSGRRGPRPRGRRWWRPARGAGPGRRARSGLRPVRIRPRRVAGPGLRRRPPRDGGQGVRLGLVPVLGEHAIDQRGQRVDLLDAVPDVAEDPEVGRIRGVPAAQEGRGRQELEHLDRPTVGDRHAEVADLEDDLGVGLGQ